MMDFDFTNIPSSDDPLYWPAEMTRIQFLSLSRRIQSADLIQESQDLDFFAERLRATENFDRIDIIRWLKNSWNTEIVLRGNQSLLVPGNSFPLQWAFPQSYYSVFASTLALFKTCGYTQSSHTAVLKHYGTLLSQNKYPISLKFYCSGHRNNIAYHGITKPTGMSSISYDVENSATIDNQICQFLKTTRAIQLEEKAKSMKIRTSSGRIKKRLNTLDWNRVSRTIGYTNLLNLLYRKRIKANYQDIETFTYEGIAGNTILDCLILIVEKVNFVNELFIAKALGINIYDGIYQNAVRGINQDFLSHRYESINATLS